MHEQHEFPSRYDKAQYGWGEAIGIENVDSTANNLMEELRLEVHKKKASRERVGLRDAEDSKWEKGRVFSTDRRRENRGTSVAMWSQYNP